MVRVLLCVLVVMAWCWLLPSSAVAAPRCAGNACAVEASADSGHCGVFARRDGDGWLRRGLEAAADVALAPVRAARRVFDGHRWRALHEQRPRLLGRWRCRCG